MSESAAQVIARAGGAIPALRNAPDRPAIFPVTPEFTNWRSEQRAWRDGVALLDQSHHMTDLFISGPDALKLLSDTGVNNFSRFTVGDAKQFVAVNYEGYLVGDAVLFYLAENRFDLVGWYMVIDWVQFIGETGDYDVTFERDANSIMRDPGKDPVLYRYEIQGPKALAVMEKVIGGPVPDTKFFGTHTFTIAGVQVDSLRHGMAGQPGFELFGPWAEREGVREAILTAGEEFGLVLAGARAYSTANLESAWVPSPIPAVFTGERTAEYLDWLPASRIGSNAGSFVSDDIEDYYLTPYDIGYGRTVAFDHDFIGREALEKRAEKQSRKKVTLVWNPADVAAIQRSQYEPGTPAKYLEFPKARYGLYQMDRVEVGGELVGISHDVGYITNEQAFVSLASVDLEHAEPGTEVTLVWGESPNSTKPAVEEHRQITVRATVQPAPYSSYARENYRKN
ncbi:MAG: aminomethyltransferase family protein [Microbacterium sp.]|uniref:aminomethyl transferase family protein n=1 Tax=Microbacterium sp. TaxID=51671 RepID=UPI001AC1378C|nr:aminomethyl transferase family protein [Microbacterium sp.]MBN9155595.1 aminomethyltransferase family protein [Microbacterium sp.]MBN9171873.1 aminomethyltransferase family protein [Microbacterium sp.]MBN9173200.1 aminomethyltransferase family protein [Microbacterium sp.]